MLRTAAFFDPFTATVATGIRISTLAEEAEGGGQAIGKASIAALLLVGFLFILQTYIAALVWPDYTSFENLDTAFYDVAFVAGGSKLMWLCSIATGFAWGIANSLAAQAAISRIIFSMSRDRALPKGLSKVHPRYQTPYVATIFVAVISLALTLFFEQQIDYLSSLVNFGALTAFLVLNFAVIYYFFFKKKTGRVVKHSVFYEFHAEFLNRKVRLDILHLKDSYEGH